jgi:hypothetical protein
MVFAPQIVGQDAADWLSPLGFRYPENCCTKLAGAKMPYPALMGDGEGCIALMRQAFNAFVEVMPNREQ